MHGLHRRVVELALPCQIKDFINALLLLFRVVFAPLADPEAVEADVLENEKWCRKRHGLLGHGAVGDDVRALRELFGHVVH